jgi:hypothetical protein
MAWQQLAAVRMELRQYSIRIKILQPFVGTRWQTERELLRKSPSPSFTSVSAEILDKPTLYFCTKRQSPSSFPCRTDRSPPTPPTR